MIESVADRPDSVVEMMTMGLSARENSAMTWRHAPQGRARVEADVKTPTATMSMRPAVTAWKIATRSAHTVKPNDAFSMLQPS